MKCYITTPIYYPNAKPHLGSAYTTIAADFAARLYRELGYNVFFLTGTDEHGEKLAKTAEEKGKSPKEFVDEMALAYRQAWKELNISYDRFIRTTDEDHKKVVREILQRVHAKGDIYKGKYEGQYCVGCERYYTEKELVDGKCPYHLKEVENKSIEAYFFKLSKYREKLLSYYEKNPKFLPPKYKDQIINNMKELKDLCISRPKEQVSWGIALPFDEEHVAYVWFDALLNYLSGAPKEFWPPDLQMMGKDIIWFHCVIWPAMLMAAGEALPRRELAHGFLTVDGKKMSKSLGNVVDPLEVAKKYGNDALRYYLLTKVPFGDDGDFSWELFRATYANELIGHYGNLANRLIKLAKKCDCVEGEYPRKAELESLREELKNLAAEYELEEILRFYGEKVWREVTEVNAYLNEKEPWRDTENGAKVVGACTSAFVFLSVLLKPLLPEATSKILEAYGEDASIENVEFKLHKPRVEGLIVYEKVED